ncbi:MAG TPA: di-heme oxidoredictase family protein [Pyrinomonadaceae bacterium]|jgi:mono/diheme cytochrome c family protein|nr:di-heme oxidoredictase family protein [Pyrinomonadaceae bacterium]
MKAKPNAQILPFVVGLVCLSIIAWLTPSGHAQLPDKTVTPNTAGAGINKSFAQQAGAGRGDLSTLDSSLFIINRDPFRAIRRGRQLFQRKYTRVQGIGPLFGDGTGNIETSLAIGAGLVDSCAGCHGRPRGAAGSGGDVVTRPDSRDAPHLFGLGLKEMLADEITTDLRAIRQQAIDEAQRNRSNQPVTKALISKGISYGAITARRHGNEVKVDTSAVTGVDTDLRIRPFFAHGGTISIREFIVGAWNAEMGLQAVDPELAAAHDGRKMISPSGMVLDGTKDQIEAPPAANTFEDPDGDGVSNEIPTSIVDFMEFYLLNYFKPATYEQTPGVITGRQKFQDIGCSQCHIPDLQIDRDRRVADLETVYDSANGIFNNLFATASPLFTQEDDGSGFPTLKRAAQHSFLVKNIFTDLKRHDLGSSFYERNYDGTIRRMFLTTPLWGVGTTAPYGHDGRSINLREVILRHGGEALGARDAFAALSRDDQYKILDFLNSLVIFPPDDTASNLDPGNRSAMGFPQGGHGSVKLTVLFNNPLDIE